ncbi:MAG: acetylornithine deacetylase [Gammaproteobacteria bacterium]|nr:acetylornithine deacetylase [Gammaproteobacteria bacterium]MDH3450545.1 acetylornithine deacetylase [Gammaproteobacteria bacterium]
MNSEEILARLVSFDTTSTKSNLELIDFVRNLLDDHGIASQLLYNDDMTRANLYATLGPDDIGGVMLSGHTDVVPTLGQDWHSDPYRLKVTDHQLYGRGSCDMKGFIACVLAALPQMTAGPLQTPLHLAFSYDEEIGCVGAKRLVEKMAGFEVKPRVGLIGEPTGMRMVLGHKGKVSYRVTITGLACHSAYISSGVNAVEYAAELVAFIRNMNSRVQQELTDSSYSVPHTTFHVGNIGGGTALNIVPNHCQFEFEIRNLPQQELDALVHEIRHYADAALLPEMRERYPDSDIRFDEISSYPGLHTDPASAVIACTRAVNPVDEIGDNVSFGTEAGLFDAIGINSLVCGPGSIDQAHRPDEFVDRAQLRYCDEMIENLVHRCLESAKFV